VTLHSPRPPPCPSPDGAATLAGGRHAARLAHDSDGPAWGSKEMRLVRAVSEAHPLP